MAIADNYVPFPVLMAFENMLIRALGLPASASSVQPGTVMSFPLTVNGMNYAVLVRGQGLGILPTVPVTFSGVVTSFEVIEITDPNNPVYLGFMQLPFQTSLNDFVYAAVGLAASGRTTPDLQDADNVNFVTASDFFDLILPPNGGFGMIHTGSSGADIINGYVTDDNLNGAGGDDVIRLSPGTDTLQGGDGTDTVDGSLADSAITLNAPAGQASYGTNTASLSGVEAFVGSDFADTMTLSDILREVFGGLGNDTITGSAGDDTISGNEGDDQIDGGAGNDSLDGDDGNDTLQGGDGNDSLRGGRGDDLMEGGGGDDLFTNIDGGLDTFRGGDGVDTLVTDVTGLGFATMTFDAVNGTHGRTDPPASQDVVDSIENFTLIGDWNGILIGDGAANALTSDAGDDSLVGNDGNDTLDAGAGDDVLEGGNGDDTLLGGAGNDTINDGSGFDVIDGGDGIDLFARDYGGSFTFLPVIDLIQGRIFAQGETAFETILNIENTTTRGSHHHTVIGTQGANRIETGAGDDTLQGNGGDDTLVGGTGNDSMDGGAGSDTAVFDLMQSEATVSAVAGGIQVVSALGTDVLQDIEFLQFNDGTLDTSGFVPGQTVDGTGTGDTLAGAGGPDTISGGGGSDVISGGGGNDTISGGIGFDSVSAGDGNDTVVAGDGYDSVSGGAGDDLITGNNGFDLLQGDDGNDTLSGGLGTDTLEGGDGDDVLNGQSGFDSLDGGAGNDTLNGNSGADTLRGGNDDDLLNGGIANDVLSGDAGNDTLNGGNGADTLSGDSGDDRLEGNGGSDYLHGGAGNDVLRGGLGADTFDFEVGDGHDRIVDLGKVDTVELDSGLLNEAAPVPDDLRNYASFNSDGFLVLTFATGDTLTFTGIVNTTAILDNVDFV